MTKQLEHASKFLSLVLRHKPDAIGLTLDSEGWADLDSLISLANANGQALSHELVFEIVARSDKQRFALNSERTRIRANQGHSVQIDLNLQPQTPPAQLFHGTATRFADSIRKDGLLRQSRQHVHLSATIETATAVGARHGKPLVLAVRALEMQQAGAAFYLSDNGVWLTDAVPVQYIDFQAI